MTPEGMPEWVAWIGAAIGSMLGAFVLRMGWKSAGGKKRSEESATYSLDAALVDSASIKNLTAAIEGHTLEMLTGRMARLEHLENAQRMTRLLNALTEEMKDLRGELRELGDAVARRK